MFIKLSILFLTLSLISQIKSEPTLSPTNLTSSSVTGVCTPNSASCCSGSLSLATSVTSIGLNAYNGCGAITTLTVQSTVTFIGY